MVWVQRLGLSMLLAAGVLLSPWQAAFYSFNKTHTLATGLVVFAAKKKSKKADTELQAKLDPLLKQLQTLRLALQNRKLFSYKDLQTLDSLQSDLALMAAETPGSPLLARPLFQLAQVLEQRERWLEAYEFYSLVNKEFNGLPVAALAEKSMKRLSGAHGDLLPDAMALPQTATTAASAGGGLPATTGAKVKVP
jgi:hypothetical protein